MKRPCLDCGEPTTGTRCLECRRPLERAHHNRAYDDPNWKRLRDAVLWRWRRDHGDWCPGDDRHEGHATADLTVDHIVPLAAGGELLDMANTRVLCREANGRKGSRVEVSAR